MKITGFEDALRYPNLDRDLYNAQNFIKEHQADVFNAGIILFTLVLGFAPSEKVEILEFFPSKNIIQTRFRFWKKVGGEFLSENFMDLVGRMLLPDSVFTAKDIRAHKWMKNDISESSISDSGCSL